MKYKESLKVGLIQTTLNPNIAWESLNMRMTKMEEIRVWREIRRGFRELKNHSTQPNIILLPELTIPIGYEEDIKRIAKKLGVVVIGGLDFQIDDDAISVMNRAIIVIPQKWPEIIPSGKVSLVHFGKTFFSYMEKNDFKEKKLKEKPDPNMYILDAGEFGRIGVAICSDFFDIERFVIYKGKIHHMIVIALNKDISSYYFLCEAISRLVYCNVIICNSGFYGGSVVHSPYSEAYQRVIYKHEGKELFTTQVVELPVLALDNAQKEPEGTSKVFKSKPPGYDDSIPKAAVIKVDLKNNN